MIAEIAFSVILSFSVAGHPKDFTKYCPTQECVDEIRTAAPTDPLVQRLRVYEGKAVMFPSGVYAGTPLVDEWYH